MDRASVKGSNRANALAVSPDGMKVFVTGSSQVWPLSEDYATVAYDASTGATLWLRRYNGPGNGDDVPTSIEASPRGDSLFVTGYSAGEGSVDFATIAYEGSTGAMHWLARYHGPGNSDYLAYSLGVSPDGTRVFVTGSFPYLAIAYDVSTGNILWSNIYSHRESIPAALRISPDGNKIFVTGMCGGSASNYDYCTLALTASMGAILWVSRYDGLAHDNDLATALGVTPDGTRVFVTGESPGLGTDYDYATVA